jgi:hypothetical protein
MFQTAAAVLADYTSMYWGYLTKSYRLHVPWGIMYDPAANFPIFPPVI